MGIDLKILASNFRERRGEIHATAEIRLDRDPRVLSIFSKQADPCVVEQLPDGLKVSLHTDDGLKLTEKDSYGQPLTFTTSDKLKTLPAIEEIGEWNRAALAFLLTLPPDTKIVLYWC